MEFTQAPDHKNWAPARKLKARDGAKALADLQNFVTGAAHAVLGSSVGPWLFLAVAGGLFWFAGWAGVTLSEALPKP